MAHSQKGVRSNTGRTHIKKGQRISPATEFTKGFTPWNKGKKLTLEHRAALRGPRVKTRGSNNHKWKGGVSTIHDKIRKSPLYRLWRQAVLMKDKFTCLWCGVKKQAGVILHVDHIKRFSDYPELRFAIDNGRVLCAACHKTTETYGPKRAI